MSQNVATIRTVPDLIEEYEFKRDKLDKEIEAFKEAEKRFLRESLVMSQFVESPFSTAPYVSETRAQIALLKSAWKAIYVRLNIAAVAPARDKEEIDRMIDGSPFELTIDNAISVFGDYIRNTRHHVLRGLIECFVQLDPFYKSHSKFRIGVKGIPKRIVINNFTGTFGRGEERVKNIVNAMRVYKGLPLIHRWEDALIRAGAWRGRDFVLPRVGLRVKIFKNGNAHVFFNDKALEMINGALEEWYGPQIPDDAYKETSKPQSKEVSADLAFYRTPKKAAEWLIGEADLRKDDFILEPSCGDGALLDAMRGHKTFGYEFHGGRVQQCRDKGHNVKQANFLQVEASPQFDKVVMNPPFAGKHYQKHVDHALKFLKPGGVLVAILPATARYDHGFMSDTWGVSWQDLPVGSFSESGTNVGTVILKAMAR